MKWLQLRAQYKDMAQYQDIKTGKVVFDLYKAFNLHKTLNLYKTFDLYKTYNIHKTFNIYRILLLLDDYSGAYKVSKVCKDKVNRPVLDVEKVIVLLSTNAKN